LFWRDNQGENPAPGALPGEAIRIRTLIVARHLSEPIQPDGCHSIAINTDPDQCIDAKVLEFLQAAQAPNTRHAYSHRTFEWNPG